MAGNGTPELTHPDRTQRRLNLARRIVLVMSTTTPLFCVLTSVFAFVSQAPSENMVPLASRAPGVLSLVLGVLGVLCSLVLAWFSMRVVRTRIDRTATTLRRDVVLSYLALLATIGLLGPAPAALSAAQFWGASVAVTGRRRNKVAYTGLMLAAGVIPSAFFVRGAPLSVAVLVPLFMVGLQLFVFLVMVYSNAAIILLWDIVTEAHAAREAQARLAVSEERLRFSRDMHDLLGHSLSALAVKSELAARLAEIDPQGAAREMTAVQHLARDALREVRTAVSGYRDIDLDTETASVQAVLAAAGVRCTVTGAEAGVPTEQRAIASWVVREGTTNVLRHSSAKRCAITVSRDSNTLIIEIFNDGVHASNDDAVPFGNGLSGLAERVAAAGGALTASLTSGGSGFLLRAVLSLPERRPAPASDPPAEPAARKDVHA